MNRTPQTYIELRIEDVVVEETIVDELASAAWFDEKTKRIDFDQQTLSPEVKLVAGYLTMEAHDMFGHLSIEEQQQIANTLKR